MMILPASLISSLLRRKPKRPIRKLTDHEKTEIQKIDNMEFFDAIDYLINKNKK